MTRRYHSFGGPFGGALRQEWLLCITFYHSPIFSKMRQIWKTPFFRPYSPVEGGVSGNHPSGVEELLFEAAVANLKAIWGQNKPPKLVRGFKSINYGKTG